MSNEILDEDIQYTGSRTCPKCGHQFPFMAFFKRHLMSYGLSKWNCQQCSQSLKYDFIKIQLFWLIGLLIAGGLTFFLLPYFKLEVLNIIILILYLSFISFTLFRVKFEKD